MTKWPQQDCTASEIRCLYSNLKEWFGHARKFPGSTRYKYAMTKTFNSPLQPTAQLSKPMIDMPQTWTVSIQLTLNASSRRSYEQEKTRKVERNWVLPSQNFSPNRNCIFYFHPSSIPKFWTRRELHLVFLAIGQYFFWSPFSSTPWLNPDVWISWPYSFTFSH